MPEVEDIILPESTTNTTPPSTNPAQGQKQQRLATPRLSRERIVIIIMSIIIVGLTLALLIVLLNRQVTQEPQSVTDSSTLSFRYDRNELNSALNRAEASIDANDPAGAESILKAYATIERMTNAQRYRYYLIMAYLYSDSGYGDSDRESTYRGLAEKCLEAIRRGEE